MSKKFIIIKIKLPESVLLDFINESYNHKVYRYYNVFNDIDQKQIENLKCGQLLNIVFITYEFDNTLHKIQSLYVGNGEIVENKGKKNIKYKVEHKIENELIVNNFILSNGIDLKSDFLDYSYIIMENANIMYKKLYESVSKFDQESLFDDKHEYKSINAAEKSPLYQKNEYCKRYFSGIKNNPDEHREEFQRDRERILHSKAFRRLVDKAQIFTSTRGDHFRTRMTHTLEVSQIARGIAKELGVNEDLTEAIALAHDIGHTPFGHQGERTLQSLLEKEMKKLPVELTENRRFKHNFQGLKVVSSLEEKYLEHDGLNLSYQVLEGILKHTDSCKKKNITCECNHNCVDLTDFLINGDLNYLFLNYKYPTTIEGQIVRIADEIAQRGHDLDDAFASKLLSYKNFKEICSIRKFEKIFTLIDNIEKRAEELQSANRYFIDKHDTIRAELVSSILGYLIADVIITAKSKIEKFDITNELFVKQNRICELLVTFSDDAMFIVNYLENEIKKKVINSKEVAHFDDSAEKIITALFYSYLNNPKLLPNSTLRRIFYEFKRKNLSVIDFRDGDLGLVFGELKEIVKYNFEENSNKEYAVKFDILLHCIVDHISGMTDNFAINEYEKLK